jgi:hypothetical protein
MGKKARRTGENTTSRKTPEPDELSIELGAVAEPVIDLGQPQEVPAEHLVDDPPAAGGGLSIDLGPTFQGTRENKVDPRTRVRVGIPMLSESQPWLTRRRLWMAVALVAALGVVVLVWLRLPGEPQEIPATRATVEGHVVLTAPAAQPKVIKDGQVGNIDAGHVVEAKGLEVSGLAFTNEWVLWLQPGTKVKVLKAAQDMEVELLAGRLGASSLSTRSVLWIRMGETQVLGDQARFEVHPSGVAAGGGTVKVYLREQTTGVEVPRGKRLVLPREPAGSDSAEPTSQPVLEDAPGALAWMPRKPVLDWTIAYKNDFRQFDPDEEQGDVDCFEVIGDHEGPMLTALEQTLQTSAVLTLGAPADTLRASVELKPQQVSAENAAMGIVFGHQNSVQYHELVYMPNPTPRVVLLRHTDTGVVELMSADLEDADRLGPAKWHTLAIRLVDKELRVSLNGKALGPADLEHYRRGYVGLTVSHATARFRNFLLRTPKEQPTSRPGG